MTSCNIISVSIEGEIVIPETDTVREDSVRSVELGNFSLNFLSAS